MSIIVRGMLALCLMASPGLAAECRLGTLDEAKALAESAAAHLEAAGPETALRDFMEPRGGFIRGDLYVFVLDFNGLVWANGAAPEGVGSDASMAQTADGRFFIQEMIHLAQTAGQGWVEYDFYNPCTHEVAPKASFVKRVGDLIVGAGAYGTISL